MLKAMMDEGGGHRPRPAQWHRPGTEDREPDVRCLERFSGRRRCFAAQDRIYYEQDRGQAVYRIRSGLVKMITYLPSGRARIVRLHGAGDSIGLEGVLGRPYCHTAVAVGRLEVDHYAISGVADLERDDPHLLGELLGQWQDHLARADRWIADFSTGAIKARVARLLLYLAELEPGLRMDTVEVLRGHEMADILGVTPESVSRILAALKRDGLLERCPEVQGECYRMDRERLGQVAAH